jgi:hypothetical protein
MRYISLVLFLLLFSQCALGEESSPQEICRQRGDIAMQASKLRVAGVDKQTAIETLVNIEKAKQTGVAENLVKGAVHVSYMTKMEPVKMREYYISECNKDIMR